MVWKELVKTALLGTENSTLQEAALQELQSQNIDVQQDMSLVVMNGAALYSQFKKAGFQLASFDGPLPKEVAIVEEKLCSLKSAHHLGLILGGKFQWVLPEFIELILKNEKYLPTEHIPALLRRPDVGDWWEALQPALGEKGRWLLAQHPDWRLRLADVEGLDWHTGSKEERKRLLRHLRKTDPDTGLEMLLTSWETEDYQSKAAFLGELAIELSLADEAFLEKCLDEGRKEVRLAALHLLKQLADARFSERMYQRAVACFDFKKGKLDLHIPEEIGKSEERDGILKIHTSWKGGAKAGYLGQVVSCVAPEKWLAFFQKNEPGEVLEIFSQTDWAGTLLKGSALAALLFRDEKWVEAFLEYWFVHDPTPIWSAAELGELITAAPAATVNRLRLTFFEKNKGLPDETSPVFKMLVGSDCPWEGPLALLVVERFQQWLATSRQAGWQTFYLKELLKALGLKAPASLHKKLEEGWDRYAPMWGIWEKPVEDMLNLLLFRKEMAAEMGSSAVFSSAV